MRRDPRTVAVVVSDGAPLFETAIPLSVFGVDRTDSGGPRYRVVAVAADDDAETPTTTAGIGLGNLHRVDAIDGAGIVVVPTWSDPDRTPPASLTAALRRAHDDGATIVGLCLGAFVLAAAGLLDGRRATTHWRWAALLREKYPAVDVDVNVLYVDEDTVVTSAGTAAGIDACLALVRRLDGAHAAGAVARRMVVSPHRAGGQAQFVDIMPPRPRDDTIGALLDWALANLHHPLTVDQLAARLNTSRRTLDRHFRAATGTSPLQWLLHQRILAAQRLLETTTLPVEHVAAAVGFSSAIALRPHFRQIVGVSPRQYRESFSPSP
ncbi:GlxA family transcriptional regulator [Xylanimonas ulmi]|uniref:Transcriptional regulator GlxA family with amidase domain n=1 Tax=Xylanimonas ulmi TaxID=228973 RepID=A0A4Q7M0K0_9MICO|nr:helix-turn-helix domain-containing protein [Xylanibacterium ulmi]RZS60701.1 transcriptional regulator GlxA family with amidase domain [Xylanibacterium ulmi]